MLSVVASGPAVRRRAQALGGDSGGPAAPAPLEERFTKLCLPFDAPTLARLAPRTALAVLVVATLVGGPMLVLVVAIGLAGGALFLHKGASLRRDLSVDRELPLVLEGVARHLRAGASLSQAIATATPKGPSPLASNWSRMASDLELVGLVAALERWASAPGREARPSERLTASALALAAESGGSPARAIDGVAATLRARLAVAEEIRALSSQARSSAAVIAAAPLGFGLLAAATDERTAAFFRSTIGMTMLAGGLALDAVGAWWMAWLCRSAER